MSENKKKYWSTLEEYYNDPEVERLRGQEFFELPQKTMEPETGPAKFNRRDFMKLGGAAAIFSLVACGERPLEKIVPYSQRPEEITPGIPVFYATTCPDSGCGIIVKTREGRPIKLEGNPDHPLNRGRLTARGQASLLDLYDPARLKNPVRITSDGSREDAKFPDLDQEIVDQLNAANGRVILLTGKYGGPARMSLVNRFLGNFQNSRHVQFEPLIDCSYRDSRRKAFGSSMLPDYDFSEAQVVVSFGADMFGSGRNRIRYMTDFARKRKVDDGQMSKVYMFEPAISEMGANVDERYLVKTKDLQKIAGALANELIIQKNNSRYADNQQIANAYSQYKPGTIEEELHLEHGLIARVADDLWQNRGNSLVLSESFSNQHIGDQFLHLTVHLINSILGNEGTTITTANVPGEGELASLVEMKKLIADIKAGGVSALFIYNTNPAYSLPHGLGFEECLKNVPLKVSFSDRIDETAKLCDYVLPSLHTLESWGDSEALRGLYAIQQPTITPLWDNRQFEDSLIALGTKLGISEFSRDDQPIKFYDYLRDYWRNEIYGRYDFGGDFDAFWIETLQKGLFESADFQATTAQNIEFNADSLNNIRPASSAQGVELRLVASSLHHDGRSMNNAWLLETPDPVSRITWDNYLIMAPSKAREMGLKEGDVVKLTANDVTVEVPVHLAPGTHKDCVELHVGWGRTDVGMVGNGRGVNAFKLANASGNSAEYTVSDVKIEKTDKNTPLASVQGHHYIEHRPILFETTLEEYKEDPSAGIHKHHYEKMTMWKQDHRYPGHKWGMVIDMNSCIGCNACITACQVENNIPVVGKEQVLIGREMHWIRVDRYFSGEEDNPDVTHQPMLCHHCDDAPCETVCPVLAAVHNDEGLNLQVYNRCVGTRYCSNNCPYKVRRFNFHHYAKQTYEEKPLQMLLNPDVTVRSTGVMEKCTFCIQRIRDARHKAKSKGQPIGEGEVLTACQQTCPTAAISFGDLNKKDSQVSKESHQPRAFMALEELNIGPNVSFLTKIRNKKKDKDSDDHGSH